MAIVAGEQGLGVHEARALLRLRRAQLAARDGARGALVKLELRDGRPDLAATAARSPLLPDFFRLMVLELLDCFPAQTRRLRPLLRRALRPELAEPPAAASDHVAWAAARPIIEAVAAGLARHRKVLPSPSALCPVCGAAPYARHLRWLACSRCETRFSGKAPQLPRLGAAAGAFNAAPLLELVRALRADPALQSRRG